MTANSSPSTEPGLWPGERWGLPEKGPRSVARWGRRIIALLLDWYLSVLVIAVVNPAPAQSDAAHMLEQSTQTLLLFALTQIVFQITLSGSIGHLITGLRVVPVRGGYIGLWRPIVRTVLLCLVIPALIWDSDQRGLHDRAAGTVLVRK